MPGKNETALTRRTTAKQQRSKEKVELILQTTLDMLSEGQTDKINTNEIARRAGISVGSLYHFFPNKETIFYELFRRWLSQTIEILDNLDAEFDGSEPIQTYIDSLFERLSTNYEINAAGHWQLRRSMNSSKELSQLEEAHVNEILARFLKIQEKFGRQIPPEKAPKLAYLQNLISVSCLNLVALTTDPTERKMVMQWCKNLLYMVFDLEELSKEVKR